MRASAVGVGACLIGIAHAQQQTPQTEDWLDDDTFRNAIMNSTNTYRHQHDVAALSWSDELADTAKDWAKGCVWGHSGGPTGENLATGYSSPLAAIAAWGDERSEYDFSRGDFSMATGHFTQLVWRDTERVGCARVDCGESPSRRLRRHIHRQRERERKDVVAGRDEQKAWGWYLVCEYDPPGNVLGSFDQMVPEQVNEDAFPGEGGGDQQPEQPEQPEGEPEGDDDNLVPVNDVFTNHAGPQAVPDGTSWLIGAVAVAVNLGG